MTMTIIYLLLYGNDIFGAFTNEDKLRKQAKIQGLKRWRTMEIKLE